MKQFDLETARDAEDAETTNESWALSRRAFMGGTLASTSGLALPLSSQMSAPAKVDFDGLHFIEDRDGIAIIQYPRPPTPAPTAKESPVAATPAFGASASASASASAAATTSPPVAIVALQPPVTHAWHLPRRRFGSREVTFTLRTVEVRHLQGYELRVSGARFGAIATTSHYFTFLRHGSIWMVSLNTGLLSAPAVASKEVRFTDLTRPGSQTRFEFQPISAGQMGGQLSQMFEDHIRFRGMIRTSMNADASWTVESDKDGTIHALDAVFSLSRIDFSWNGTDQVDPAPSRPNMQKARRESEAGDAMRRVIFRAEGKAEAARPLVLGGKNDPSVRLAVRLKPSDAMNDATHSRDVGVGYIPSPAADAASPPVPPLVPHWTYIRDDWRNLTDRRGPAGVSQVRAAWTLTIERRGKLALGPVDISVGLLNFGHASPMNVEFDGRLNHVQADYVTSPIGQLRVSGWSRDDVDPPLGGGKVDRKHPQVTILCPDLRGPVALIDVPLLLRGADLAVNECDFSHLTFARATLHALYLANDTTLRERLSQGESYLWLGTERKRLELPLARIDLTRARLRVSRTDRLAHLAFYFSGFHLEIGERQVTIVDTQRSCLLIRRADPTRGTASVPALEPVDARPTLVAEFPGQHVLEESIFRPNRPALPDVALDPITQFKPDWTLYKGATPAYQGVLAVEVTAFVQMIAAYDEGQRIFARMGYAEAKRVAEADPKGPFTTFAQTFEENFDNVQKAGKVVPDSRNSFNLPAEQRIYIGAGGLDPDLAAMARDWYDAQNDAQVASNLNNMLTRVGVIIAYLIQAEHPTDKAPPPPPKGSVLDYVVGMWRKLVTGTDPTAPSRARLRELAAASTVVEYGFFRDFYAETMARWRHAPATGGLSDGE